MASSSKPTVDIFTQEEHFRTEPPACFYCDEGGELVFCDGPCGKHFHWQGSSNDDGHGVLCQPVTLLDDNPEREWMCDLCSEGKILCFSCGMVGRIDNSNSIEQRVLQCAHPDCYSYYHLGYLKTRLKVARLPMTHVYGIPKKAKDTLFCPRHYCDHCKEFKPSLHDMVQCWKCPRSWCEDKKVGGKKHLCFGVDVEDKEVWEFEGWRMVYCDDHVFEDGIFVPDEEREQ